MDGYEELGLSRAASAAEIRKAYRRLALLLHPDRQEDPELRRLAELQMKRLNETVAPLMDGGPPSSAERLSRNGPGPPQVPPIVVVRPPEPHGPAPWLTMRSLWCFLAGAGLASVLWYSAADRPPITSRTAGPAADAEIEASADIAQRIRDLEQQVAELRKPEKVAGKGGGAATRSLAGAWIYQSRPLGISPKELPRSVNLQISQEGEVVRGEYSSSGGTETSPVAFHFEGTGAGPIARLPWSGGRGSNGEIELRLLRPNVLEARWWAYGTSTELGETSSTAILHRVSTP